MSVVDGTYTAVRRMLLDGVFKPGERIREPELAADLGVSRTPLREALRSLHAEGLITLAGRGATVISATPEQIYDLYQFRAVLEGFTAERAAERNAAGELAPAQIVRLWSLVDVVGAASGDAERVEANLALHQHIAELSGNQNTIDALSRVWAQISISSATNLTDPNWRSEVFDQHREIAQAIDEGDVKTAAQVGRAHVQAAAQVFHRVTGTV